MKPLDDLICVETIREIMNIFGGKWTFLIIGELHSGTKRFNELSRSLKINTRTLTDALKKLELNGIIKRKVIETTPISVEYSLTDKGKDFEKVFVVMKEWGMTWLNNEV